MREIPLTQGYAAMVDDDCYDEIARYRWHAQVIPQKNVVKVYAARNDGPRKVYMHRHITGADSSIEVDHENGNGLDNQRSNLRLTPRVGNNRNVNGRRGVSGYVGVFYCDPIKYPGNVKRPWKASLAVDSKKIHVGFFETAIEAAIARDRAAKEYHGEFAVLNFPAWLT